MNFIDDHVPPLEIEAEQNEIQFQDNHQSNKFLHQKRLIIVDEKCQAIVPDKPEKIEDTKAMFIKHKQDLIFQTEKISNLEGLDDYLLFAQSLILNQSDEVSFEEPKKKSKGFSGDGLILSGLTITQDQAIEKALNFLKLMDYNIIKAKFYLLFPTLKVYNSYKHQHAMQFTNDYMNEKIDQYISKLNEDKIMQQNKWRSDLMELINSKQKVHLNQLQQQLELGQSLKYEIPEQIKQIYQQSMQIQRQLNKLPKEKQTLEKLRLCLEKYEDQIPVITTEIQQLREQVQKSEIFYSKLIKLPIPLEDNLNFEFEFEKLIAFSKEEKIPLKILANYNQEYKQLPIEIKAFELLHKRLYEYVLDLIEKISKFTKIQQTKTRLGQQISNQGEKTEKMTLQSAGIVKKQIDLLIVSCDDFDNFNEVYQQAIELNQKANEQIDDPEIQQKLLVEVLDCPFYLDVQERLQSMIDYTQILESIKQKMSERKHAQANQQILQLMNRGITNGELKQLQIQTEKVLEWNQFADEVLNYDQSVTLADVYNQNFELLQYPITLTSPEQEIINQLDPEKVQQIHEINERIQEWKEQLIQLIDSKQNQNTQRKTAQNKTFQKLWDLFREGLKYKTELTLMNKVRSIIVQILDWYAQVYIIKQTLRLADDISTHIEGIEQIYKMFIQRNGTLTNLEQVEKLQKFQSPFVNGTKDLQVIEALTLRTEKWHKEAKEALQNQNQEQIELLLSDAVKLPVNEQLVNELQAQSDANLKVSWILTTITQRDSQFNTILEQLSNDETFKELRLESQTIYSQFLPQNKKKKDGIKLSTVAQEFYQKFQKNLNYYLQLLSELDESKLKKIQQIKISRIKEVQKEVQNPEVYQTIEDWTQQYQFWLNQISNLSDSQTQQKKKKKSKDQDTFAEQYILNGDLLYYFKVPEMLSLVLQGINNNFLSTELFESIQELVEIYRETQNALQVQSTKEVKHYSEVFMPAFYVMAKKFRVINNWIKMAQDMINDIPRLKNLIMISKLKPFLEYLDSLKIQDSFVQKPLQSEQNLHQQQQSTTSNLKKKIQKPLSKFKATIKSQEESQPTYDQESQSIKHSKRVKVMSKLMQDDNIAFYDANVPLGKAFRQPNNEILQGDSVMQALKKQAKRNYKRTICRKPPLTSVDISTNSSNFLESIRASSEELLKLYSNDKIYCTCRQGGESAITDFQIIKSLEEKNVEQFYHHHAKLQLQVKYMICCDNCEEWYHYECMGIRNKKDQDKYICRICLQKNNVHFLILNDSLWEQYLEEGTDLFDDYYKQKNTFEKQILPSSGEYIYSNFELPSVKDFRDFLDIGRRLPASLVELELLIQLEERIDNWIKQYENNKLLPLVDLIALFAESEWLPVQLPQAKILLCLVSQKEFLNSANEQLSGKATFKTKYFKKQLLERTELLYQLMLQKNPEILSDVDHTVIKTIAALRIQSELNNSLQQHCKQPQMTLEMYEQLVTQFDEEFKKQCSLIDLRFTFPKLTELKQGLLKLQQWDNEIIAIFKDLQDIYTLNLYYDDKPYLSDVQVKIKEFEFMPIKTTNLGYEFLKALQAAAEDFQKQISNLQSLSVDEQFELCKNIYRLKCRIPQYGDLLKNVHIEVQRRLSQWPPIFKFIKAGFS